MNNHQEAQTEPAGWSIPNWCALTSISRAGFYVLTHRPKTVKLRRRTVVIESPRDYLHRIAELSASPQKAA